MSGRVELISQSEYARRRGVAKSAVAKAVAEKRISLIDGKIDPAVADVQWAANTRARADSVRTVTGAISGEGQRAIFAGEGAAGPDTMVPQAQPSEKEGYNDLRTRRERAVVEREERENAREAGRLVDRETTERAIFDGFRQLRDAVMSSAPRISPKVIGLVDAREVEQIVAAELRKAFEGWEARMLERLPTKEGA